MHRENRQAMLVFFKKLQEEVFEVQKIKQAVDEEGRAPSDEEVKKIANFN